MSATHGEGVYGNAAGVTTPLDHKMAQVGEIVKTAANTIRAGLFWDGSATVVSGKANMSYDVRAFTCVTSRGSTAGAVKLSNDAVYNVATTAAPGSNSRYDVVYVWQREYSLDGTDSNPVIGVVQGTAAASPSVPSLSSFPGAIELARILVPSGVTATNSGTTITQTAPFTAAAGAVVPVRTTTERDAGSWIESQVIWLLDTDKYQRYDGSAWADLVPTGGTVIVVPTSVAVGSGSGSVATTGKVTFSLASTVSVNGCFTSTYENYLVIASFSHSTSANASMRLRASGTDDSSANYDLQALSGSSSTASAAQVLAATSWGLTGINSTQENHTIEFDSPQLATATLGELRGRAYVNPLTSSVGVGYRMLQHRSSTAFDGFSIIASAGTISGSIRVYGYNNG